MLLLEKADKNFGFSLDKNCENDIIVVKNILFRESRGFIIMSPVGMGSVTPGSYLLFIAIIVVGILLLGAAITVPLVIVFTRKKRPSTPPSSASEEAVASPNVTLTESKEPLEAEAPAEAEAVAEAKMPASLEEEPDTEGSEQQTEEDTIMKKEEKKAPAAASQKSRVVGKYDFTLMQDGYHYCLLANNGQLLYQSVGYTTLDGARAGIDTFKRAVAAARFRVRYDRGGKYSYVLDGKFYGEGYQNRANCERAIESVKRFADTTNMVDPVFSDEDEKDFRDAKAALKSASSVDWTRVAAEEAAVTKKFGKFMIDPEEGGASFTLLANNGQCLYTSRLYSDTKSATQAVEAFKKAVYIGNFFVTNDKFGNFRFALKGTGTNWYVGDSYAARERCQNSIDSVKNFVKTAEIVVNKTVLSDGQE